MRVQESVQPDILTLGSIGSKVWETLVPRTGNPKHWFQGLGTVSS